MSATYMVYTFFARNLAIAAVSNCSRPFGIAIKPDLSLILNAEKWGVVMTW